MAQCENERTTNENERVYFSYVYIVTKKNHFNFLDIQIATYTFQEYTLKISAAAWKKRVFPKKRFNRHKICYTCSSGVCAKNIKNCSFKKKLGTKKRQKPIFIQKLIIIEFFMFSPLF